MMGPILVQLPQAGDTGAVLRWQGVHSSANHAAASCICHLHFFPEYTHVSRRRLSSVLCQCNEFICGYFWYVRAIGKQYLREHMATLCARLDRFAYRLRQSRTMGMQHLNVPKLPVCCNRAEWAIAWEPRWHWACKSWEGNKILIQVSCYFYLPAVVAD